MSVHGSELKCKYLIKVNPGQVNKPAVAGDRGTGGEGEKEGERWSGGGAERDARVTEVGRERMGARRVAAKRERKGVKSAREPSVLRGGFYCRFLLAE